MLSLHHLTEPDDSEKSKLIQTIRFPKFLAKNRKDIELPKSNYNPIKLKQASKLQQGSQMDYINKSQGNINLRQQ